MQVQSINPAFGAIKPQQGAISKEVFDAISQSKVVKSFGKDFDAFVSEGTFYSPRTGKKHVYLIFDEIKPINPFVAVKNFITGKQPVKSVVLKTHAGNEDELINSVSKTRSNRLHEIYNKK